MGGGSFYKFINKDIKELNGIIVSLFSVLFLVGVGFISYKISNSYALFGDSITGSKTIEVEASTPLSGAETIIEKVGTGGLEEIIHEADSTLQIGTTSDITEYRYRGSNPDNYVTFNDEIWRIIGVFPTDDGTENIENRIKIIRNELVGFYPWNDCNNNDYNSTCDDNEKNINDWTGSTLNMYLNEDYYSSLTNNAKNMIDNVKYYLGGYHTATIAKEEMYIYERKISGTEYYFGNNPNSTINKIGLIYISDYGYAASDDCAEVLSRYDDISCTSNNWLYTGEYEWLLTHEVSQDYTFIFDIRSSGGIALDMFNIETMVRPVLYLSSDVMISGGIGTSSDPYILSK